MLVCSGKEDKVVGFRVESNQRRPKWAILIHPGELNFHRNCGYQTWNRDRNSTLRMYSPVKKNILNIPFSHKTFLPLTLADILPHPHPHAPRPWGSALCSPSYQHQVLAVEDAFRHETVSLCLFTPVLFSSLHKDGRHGSNMDHQNWLVMCSCPGYPLSEAPSPEEKVSTSFSLLG